MGSLALAHAFGKTHFVHASMPCMLCHKRVRYASACVRDAECVCDAYVSLLPLAQTMTTAFSETLRAPQPCAPGTGGVHASTINTGKSSATENFLDLITQTTPADTALMCAAPSRAARRSLTQRSSSLQVRYARWKQWRRNDARACARREEFRDVRFKC